HPHICIGQGHLEDPSSNTQRKCHYWESFSILVHVESQIHRIAQSTYLDFESSFSGAAEPALHRLPMGRDPVILLLELSVCFSFVQFQVSRRIFDI
ncbi:MAG: hypothetical protein V2I33_19810, partial [Kangiellaceae bacterium]|nr:hypothetical protein [Kangiellaceae bacterium]